MIDTAERRLTVVDSESATLDVSLDSPEAFSTLARLWVTTGWSQRYTYGFTWFGRPIIQLPEDLLTVQEVIYRVRPDVIVETGVAHGGSLVFYASLFEAMGSGRVVGVDIEIRSHNRAAIETHELSHRIELIEGSSTDPTTLERVRRSLQPSDVVLVLLDSDHSHAHVSAELDLYSPLVTEGSYVVVTDGVMEWLTEVPGVPASWAEDNPKRAAAEWLLSHPEFELEDPPPIAFNEGAIVERVTHWPAAYLRRRSSKH